MRILAGFFAITFAASCYAQDASCMATEATIDRQVGNTIDSLVRSEFINYETIGDYRLFSREIADSISASDKLKEDYFDSIRKIYFYSGIYEINKNAVSGDYSSYDSNRRKCTIRKFKSEIEKDGEAAKNKDAAIDEYLEKYKSNAKSLKVAEGIVQSIQNDVKVKVYNYLHEFHYQK
ncbi:hypothetical protein [uncultured Aquitalea sp.]|uniref:hypothetical protein n=1 Tax=uncultured Aquitalea sp. TaxID=540272 RepID=UPI0025ECF364|nr:hypothetical protein [uncultured Aquitalea sp.]